ncbi:MAG: hypothetical protein V8R97_12590 [Fusicatenibacter saccharivorans]
MQHAAIEENLSEIQKIIEENEKYRKAIRFFLELHADDEKTAETLQNRKDRIAADQVQLMEGDILRSMQNHMHGCSRRFGRRTQEENSR